MILGVSSSVSPTSTVHSRSRLPLSPLSPSPSIFHYLSPSIFHSPSLLPPYRFPQPLLPLSPFPPYLIPPSPLPPSPLSPSLRIHFHSLYFPPPPPPHPSLHCALHPTISHSSLHLSPLHLSITLPLSIFPIFTFFPYYCHMSLSLLSLDNSRDVRIQCLLVSELLTCKGTS